jgi:hypothetical protein
MNIKEYLDTDGIEIGEFRPCALLYKDSDGIHVTRNDISSTATRLGDLGIQHINSHEGELVGFEIFHACTFSSKWVPIILIQAFWRDIRNQSRHEKKRSYIMRVYWNSFVLNLLTPSTWKVR